VLFRSEYADENLAQFLPVRPLNPEETRDVLDPLVDALGYLHAQALTHSHDKPSNLLAIADQLKLSSDTILPVGDSREAYRDHDVYDAPENSGNSTIHASTAADVWSLGATLVETLTQQPPLLPFDDSAEPAIPDALPQPFLEIARHSVVRDPSRRWTIAEIASHLNPELLAAAAAASASSSPSAISSATPAASTAPTPAPTAVLAPPPISPAEIPLSKEPAVPLAKLPPPPKPVSHRYIQSVPEKTISLPSYVIPIFLGIIVVLGAIVTLPKIFHRLPSTTA
jgi:serine/threonine protein kinase